MNVNTNGKTTKAPQTNSQIYPTYKEDWDNDKGYKAMVDAVFQERVSSKPRFSEGDMAVVVKLELYHQGFQVLEEFEVKRVDKGWAYREDGNCLPFSCLANITMDEKEKQALEAATIGTGQVLEGIGSELD